MILALIFCALMYIAIKILNDNFGTISSTFKQKQNGGNVSVSQSAEPLAPSPDPYAGNVQAAGSGQISAPAPGALKVRITCPNCNGAGRLPDSSGQQGPLRKVKTISGTICPECRGTGTKIVDSR